MTSTSGMMTLSGSAVAAPANRLSSSVAFGSSGMQHLCAVRPCAKANKIVAARASSNDEERSSTKPQMLVALVAAGAALTLTATPVSPAHAGLFGGGDVKVERGPSSPDFPGNEATGTKVGNNSGMRGSSNSGTPLGEGAGGSKVGENSATRGSSSTGTPLGEGNTSGSGVPNVGGVAEKAKDTMQGGLPNFNPFNMGSPDVSGAKDAASSVAGVVKDKLPGGVN